MHTYAQTRVRIHVYTHRHTHTGTHARTYAHTHTLHTPDTHTTEDNICMRLG